jgi:thiamine-phosphate pyrophosphorylase
VKVSAFPPLYAIVDAQAARRRILDLTEDLLEAGVRLIQYRDKRATSRELYEMSVQMAARIGRAQAIFILNDRADIALAADADGVHVGQDDLPVELARKILGPGKIIGISTHSIAQLEEADRSSADYIAFGPVAPTGTKANPEPVVGLAGVAEARKSTRKPLVAIGGITLEQAKLVKETGVESVAVIQALIGADDPGERARQFLEAFGPVIVT